MSNFYQRVLPSVGPFTLFQGVTGPDGKLTEQRHTNGLVSHADLEDKVKQLSMLPLNVFFATGSYAGKNRAEPTAKRALWLDLDGKDFGGMDVAVREFGVFLKASGLPAPSIFVNSGRGLHVYWCFDRDLPIGEWLPIARALKDKCVELDFAADPTATADPARVLRCPGTLNRKGETPIPCNVLTDTGLTYDPDVIAKQLAVTKLQGAMAMLAAVASPDDLINRPERDKRPAAQIRDMLDHINLPQYASRDMWITILCAVQDWSDKSHEGFDVFHEWSANQPGYVDEEDCWATWDSFEPGGGIGVGSLVKMARENGWGEPAPVIVVVGPDASFAEQMAAAAANVEGGVAATATTQLGPSVQLVNKASSLLIAASHAVNATGKERFDMAQAVHWLSNEFVLILDQEGLYFSLTERLSMSKGSIDDLLTRFMPLNSQGVPTNASAIMRRYGVVNIVNSQGFFPGMPRIYKENGRDFVNLYSEPPAMLAPTQVEVDLFADFWDYVFPNEEDKIFGTYLLNFYAHVVQKPAIKITSAPLMVSAEFGTGKTTMMWNIPRLLCGLDNARKVSNSVLRSQFTDYLVGVQFLHFDEVHINGRWDSADTANKMKDVVTGETSEIHPKGLKPYNIPNRLFVTATSNYDDAISMPSDDERRWGIYYLRPTRAMTGDERKAYFRTLHQFLDGPRGAGVLRWIFSQVDISQFNPHAPPPMTAAKRMMVEKSQLTEVQIIINAVRDGSGPFCRDLFYAEQVAQWLHGETGKTYPNMAIKGYLSRAIPNAKIAKQMRMGNDHVRIWCLRDHERWKDVANEEIKEELKR
jgi:hypothetical protein